jgi:hypothetical protein
LVDIAQMFTLREKIRNCTKCSKICEYLLSTQNTQYSRKKNALC